MRTYWQKRRRGKKEKRNRKNWKEMRKKESERR